MTTRRVDIDEVLIRPGTYFNPQTEVLLVVDDSASIDQEIFNMEDLEGADWVLVAEDLPLDEPRRDELIERFQERHHGGDGRARLTGLVVDDDDEIDADLDEDEDEDEDDEAGLDEDTAATADFEER